MRKILKIPKISLRDQKKLKYLRELKLFLGKYFLLDCIVGSLRLSRNDLLFVVIMCILVHTVTLINLRIILFMKMLPKTRSGVDKRLCISILVLELSHLDSLGLYIICCRSFINIVLWSSYSGISLYSLCVYL